MEPSLTQSMDEYLIDSHSYKNAVDGLYQVFRKEGVLNLFNGASTATMRASVVSVGQISFYEQVKEMLLLTPYFDDNMITHFTASFAAVSRKCIHKISGYFLQDSSILFDQNGEDLLDYPRCCTRFFEFESYLSGCYRDNIDTTSWRPENPYDECCSGWIQRSHGLHFANSETGSDDILQGLRPSFRAVRTTYDIDVDFPRAVEA